MKFSNIKRPLSILLVAVVGLTACLKDKDFDNGKIQSIHGPQARIISLGLNTQALIQFATIALSKSPNDTTFGAVPVELSGGDPAPQDIHVTLVQTDSLVKAFNDSAKTNYAVPTAFTLPNGPVVTIPKGKSTGYLMVKVNPMDYYGPYALGYVIGSVKESGYSIASGFQNNGIVSVITKNIYDGIYKRKGYVLRAGDPILSGYTGPDKIRLGTVSLTGNQWMDNHLWGDGASGMANSVGLPIWTVNPDNSVTVTSNGGPFPGGLKNLPGYNCRYDPATKTYYVAATWGGGPGVREMYDTLTYSGPR